MLLIVLAAPNVNAQEKPTVQLTEEQIALNNRAVKNMAEQPPRADEAVRLTQAALVVGKKGNLLYLTLGRAYQLQKKCKMAQAEFDRALAAPGVEGIPKTYVTDQIAVYQKQLTASCPGTLTVTCEPGDLKLSLAGHQLTCQQPLSLPSGTYDVSTTHPETGNKESLKVTIVSMKPTTAAFKFAVTAKPDPKLTIDPVTKPVPKPKDTSSGLALSGVIGVPVGLCITRVDNATLDASATNSALCYGVHADISVGFKFSDALTIAGVVSAKGIMANDVSSNERESVLNTGFDVSAGVQAWTWSERIGVEFAGTWRARSIVVDGIEAGNARPLSIGPGLILDVADFVPALDAFTFSARWMPLMDSALSLGTRIERGPLAIWISYDQWESELDQAGLVHDAEQVMAGVGFHWGD